MVRYGSIDRTYVAWNGNQTLNDSESRILAWATRTDDRPRRAINSGRVRGVQIGETNRLSHGEMVSTSKREKWSDK